MFAEAKGSGYDGKIMRKIVAAGRTRKGAPRKMRYSTLYKHALGMA